MKDMSMEDVEQLLGVPRKISGGDFTHWYYSEQEWHSFVLFYHDRLDSWTEPE